MYVIGSYPTFRLKRNLPGALSDSGKVESNPGIPEG